MPGIATKTKIIATVGPACQSPKVLTDLIKEGVDVFRLNFSHGSHEDHEKTIKSIHAINKKLGTNVAILADLQGPKIRVGKIDTENGKLPLKKDSTLTFSTNENDNKSIYISYQEFPKDVNVGDKVLIDDGKIELEVIETNAKDKVKLKVCNDGVLSSNKGVNLPDTIVSLPSLTDKDSKDLDFMLTQEVNWIALSFVRSANDVIKLKGLLEVKKHPAKIIAKIEKPQAVADIVDIVTESDAIMIARGDLGVEVPVEQMPVIQKQITRLCIENSKPVIIATQMMDSMIENPMPTRAEVSDVANAIFDGADAVMLSGETAVGKHPVRVVRKMHDILQRVEQEESIYNKEWSLNPESPKFFSDAICRTVCKIADEINANAIIGMTKSGYTAFTLSSHRPKANVYVFSENRDLLNQASLIWGVRAFYYDKFVSTDATIADVQRILKEKGYIQKGDVVMNTGSMPIHERGPTNTIKVSVID